MFSVIFIKLIATFLLIVLVAVVILIERKLLSLSQRRLGPSILGKRGILQIVADVVKPFFKEIFEQRLSVASTVSAAIILMF